ncbi:anti-sigma factor family protein [Blastococcus sp. PRF04-17]|uniref:anti-sigma factor family protein n=1 Tax=Blastococcus sp. PRF04-17 TaxID=2933797 RepID=UPI001FF23AE3|nr:zf-HC2 domain-containing protein [Blastococcus sp. PRF04-17]UOY00323.1 anti-sigma factor [Blastococcus sp. PRF04-17]
MTCPVPADGLGAYLLGALDPAERRQLDRHLAECPECAAELDELRGLPALLDRVDPDDLRPVPVAPSADLFERMSAAAGTTGRHRRRALGLVAAAVLVLGGVGAGVATWAGAPGEQTVSAVEGPVEVRITATPAEDGVELHVAVAGMRPGELCQLVAVDESGGRHPAGQWPVSADGDGEWVGWADVDAGALAGVAVLGDGGRELARLRF